MIKILSSLTLLGLVGIASWIALYLADAIGTNRWTRWMGKRAVPIAFVIALGASLGSLFLSAVAGFAPCSLCWWQRIFMFPLPIVLGAGLFRRDEGARRSVIALASIGSVFSLYHAYLQYGGASFTACGADTISCAQRLVFEFGFITIPLMTLTAFLLIIIAMVTGMIAERKQV